MKKHKSSDEQTHSKDIQKILTTTPSWLLRWGITVISALILLLIIVFVVLKYPDVVKISSKYPE